MDEIARLKADIYTLTDISHQQADEIERLRAALQAIDEINDNPSIYNEDIEVILRRALEQSADRVKE